MGFSTKQVSVDQELDWSSAVLQSELQKPPAGRRQHNPMQLEPLKCPRCDSINTKFCYYNNYNKSQPRHFCKSCKRHWTKGGTLRNVPVGGVRKNKKIKKSKPVGGSNRQKNQPFVRSQSLQNDSVNTFTENVLGNNGGFMGLMHENEGLQFSFSSLSNFDTNPPSNSIPCFESFDDYKYEPKLEAVEDPAITNLMVNTSNNIIHDNQTWELPNYWNWNDMISADLNIPWDDDDDTQIQP